MQAAEQDVRFVPKHRVVVEAARAGALNDGAAVTVASRTLRTHRIVRLPPRLTVSEP